MARKNILTALIATAVLGIAGLGAWAYWTRTPQYSLMQAAEAVSDQDTVAFQRYVDIEKTTESAIDDLLDGFLADAVFPSLPRFSETGV